MWKYIIAILSFLVLLFMLACTNHNEEEYFAAENVVLCDTLNISFGSDIFPVFENQCINCHNVNNPLGGVSLENYDEIKPFAESGLLIGVMTHDDNYSPMPKDADKLSDCFISKFRAWINEGLENN